MKISSDIISSLALKFETPSWFPPRFFQYVGCNQQVTRARFCGPKTPSDWSPKARQKQRQVELAASTLTLKQVGTHRQLLILATLTSAWHKME